MLVIDRKLNESLTIRQDINIRVLALTGTRVKLGIDAPTDIPIQRDDMRKTCKTPSKVSA